MTLHCKKKRSFKMYLVSSDYRVGHLAVIEMLYMYVNSSSISNNGKFKPEFVLSYLANSNW